jgi:antitoxin component of MazEF toxin-antitoxin module
MLKKITKIGNSSGIIFDAALLDMAHLKAGDEVSITVHEGGAITIMPVSQRHTDAEFDSIIKETVQQYGKTLKKLS